MNYAYINPCGWLIDDTIFWKTAWKFAGKPVKVIEEKVVDGVKVAICSLPNDDVEFEVPMRHIKEI